MRFLAKAAAAAATQWCQLGACLQAAAPSGATTRPRLLLQQGTLAQRLLPQVDWWRVQALMGRSGLRASEPWCQTRQCLKQS